MIDDDRGVEPVQLKLVECHKRHKGPSPSNKKSNKKEIKTERKKKHALCQKEDIRHVKTKINKRTTTATTITAPGTTSTTTTIVHEQ